jgi:hypothetical protein
LLGSNFPGVIGQKKIEYLISGIFQLFLITMALQALIIAIEEKNKLELQADQEQHFLLMA